MRGRGQPIPVGSPVKRMMGSPVRSPIRPLTPLKRMGGVLSNPMGVKRPRLPSSPYMNHNMQGALNPARLDSVARLCRVCGQESSVIFSLREKPEMVTRLKRILNLVLDLEADKEALIQLGAKHAEEAYKGFLEIEQDKSDAKWKFDRTLDSDGALGLLEKNPRAQVW